MDHTESHGEDEFDSDGGSDNDSDTGTALILNCTIYSVLKCVV